MQEQNGRRTRVRRRRRNHRWLISLAVTLTVVIGSGILVTRVIGEPKDTNPTGETEPLRREPNTVIRIGVAGDVNVTDYLLEQAAVGESWDFTDAFLDVAPTLSRTDLTLVNFEGNLSGGTYGTETGSAPLELAQALKAVGVDVVQTANSASIRQGVSGLATTLENFGRVGLMPLGTYASSADFRRNGGYEIVEVDGIRIALVAFTKGMDNLGLPAGSESCVNLLYQDYSTNYKKVDKSGINKILRKVAEEQPDITIAMVHWGSEYSSKISGTQGTIRDLLLEGGVDIILGTHPHVLQKVDYDPIAQTLVAYSLGDLIGDGTMAGTYYSVILDLEITRVNATGETYLSGFDYTPVYTIREGDSISGKHRVVRIREAMTAYEENYVDSITESVYNNMTKALEKIEERMHPKEES